MSKRFFAFGCSYTRYFYPTWANIVGSNFDEFYNYGQAGAGNRYIFNAVIEANIIHKFTKDDVIFIQWSGVERAEMYVEKAWKIQIHQNKDYMLNWSHFGDKLLELMNYASILKNWFTISEIEHKFLILVNVDDDFNTFAKENGNEIVDFYKDTIDCINPGIHNTLPVNRDRPVTIAGRKIYDGHHFPWEHYDYVEKFFPEYLPKISNLRQQLIDVYEQCIDPNLNEMDQNIELQNTDWPVNTTGINTFKFTSISMPVLIKNNNAK